MPGGKYPMVGLPDPDEDAQIRIVAAEIHDWFDAKLDDDAKEDIDDCAAGIVEQLQWRREVVAEERR